MREAVRQRWLNRLPLASKGKIFQLHYGSKFYNLKFVAFRRRLVRYMKRSHRY